jgi:hypothetical protein
MEDMETAAVARVAAEREIPFVGFRGVSDGAGDPLDLPGFPVQFFAYYRVAADNAAAATVATLQRLARLGDGRRGHERVCRLLAEAKWKKRCGACARRGRAARPRTDRCTDRDGLRDRKRYRVTTRRLQKRAVLLATGVVFLLSASPGLAKSIKKHEAKEENRIEHGVKKGKITPKEQQRLENQQQNIERERQEAWQDGKMSDRERKDIKHDQKRLDQDIQNKEDERARHEVRRARRLQVATEEGERQRPGLLARLPVRAVLPLCARRKPWPAPSKTCGS